MSMAFDYDTKYVKDTTIPYVDTLSRLRYITSESEKEEEKFEDIFLHWIETDILLIDKWAENISKWDPSILFRIKKKRKKSGQNTMIIRKNGYYRMQTKLDCSRIMYSEPENNEYENGTWQWKEE